jgi:4-amino-4-deoxy-L-arabinose transferase-like glycosyltransferase
MCCIIINKIIIICTTFSHAYDTFLFLYQYPSLAKRNMTHSSRKAFPFFLDILLLTCTLGGLFFILLGVHPLFVPDGGRYAEIAREMVTTGDYLTPHLNGIQYLEKPILFYWLESIAINIGGLNLWSLRSINGILALLGCLLNYFVGRQLYHRQTGLLSAFILGTSALYFVMAHIINMDLSITIFLTASLYAFLLASQQPMGLARRWYCWGAASAAALAVLTKGLIGLAFPLIIISSWAILIGKWHMLKSFYLPSCLLLFLSMTAPWHLIIGLHHPEFFYFYFIIQHFLRYTTLIVGHYQPFWFFLPVLAIGFFPWVIFLPQTLIATLSLWPKRREYPIESFLLIWVLFIFLFFSFSKSKLISYILPIFPPLSLLTARYLSYPSKHLLGIRLGYVGCLLLTIAIGTVFNGYARHALLPDPASARFYLGLATTLLFIGILLANRYALHRPNKALMTTILTAGLFLLTALAAVPSIDTRTIQPLVITYHQYYQDLPFYLNRRVSVVNWRNELYDGMQYQDATHWMIDESTFWQRWHRHQRVFAIMSLACYTTLQRQYQHEKVYLWAQTLTNVLVSNQKPIHATGFHRITS